MNRVKNPKELNSSIMKALEIKAKSLEEIEQVMKENESKEKKTKNIKWISWIKKL